MVSVFFRMTQKFCGKCGRRKQKTLRILPPIKNHLIPDVVHIGITILIWVN
ncbi:hypothetical protein LEP1GSC188_1081 [Leptospira weilii serovar Topaz str. LT2116]|uniref:Uncharacterized protein n=1 Tax=Leptospira weilii serovar Topaz str. LT2116 TaxID=1088540 RepID=M3EFY4_9LEPT|nr:hypothetical protein LEP1GSC188_1081 [Leptospira weilii serovar Topaz str. LT2116]